MQKIIEGVRKRFKQFKPTSWAVDNTTVIYIVAILITAYGLNKFNTLPKEQFPDIVVPTISVSTIYVGISHTTLWRLKKGKAVWQNVLSGR